METTTAPDTGTAQDAKAKVADAAGTAQDKLQGAAGQAQEKLADAKEQVQEQAANAGDQARSRAREQFDRRSNEFGDRAGDTAGDLRSVGSELRNQGKEQPAKVADEVADRVDRVADYLKRSDADALLGDLERLGRDRPWAVIAGGIALGFAASRLLKSSSTQRYQATQSPREGLPTSRPTTVGTAGSLGVTPGPVVPDVRRAPATDSPLDTFAADAIASRPTTGPGGRPAAAGLGDAATGVDDVGA